MQCTEINNFFQQVNRSICIAPMMAYTDRHFRYLMRLITRNTVLYTEMVTAQAVIHGDKKHLLAYSKEEHPVVLQLGGSDPFLLEKAAKIASDFSYDEINLNVGCPSDRVQKGSFGAALIKQPDLVAILFRAMQSAVTIPVTIKTRLGVDEYDSETFIQEFIGRLIEAGCRAFIIHARKAWLKGLNPRENREIPPLQYDRVYRLKQLFPHIHFILNGGITDWEAVKQHCQFVDGVMIGRMACEEPFSFSVVDQLFFNSTDKPTSREEVIAHYLPYVLTEYAKKVPMRHLIKPLIALFRGEPGARQWRRSLSENVSDDKQLIRAIYQRIG